MSTGSQVTAIGFQVRVIAGEARGRRLQPLGDAGVRPTPDRVREALFSILTTRLSTATPPQPWSSLRVLDLFAGSGALGIEALSRGATHAVFVEVSPQAVSIVSANLAHCGMTERATIVVDDVSVWLQHAVASPLRRGGPFDLVLADPPYAGDFHGSLLEGLSAPHLLAPAGLVVLEHETGTLLPESAGESGTLTRVDTRRYGRTSLSFYRADAPPDAPPVSAL